MIVPLVEAPEEVVFPNPAPVMVNGNLSEYVFSAYPVVEPSIEMFIIFPFFTVKLPLTIPLVLFVTIFQVYEGFGGSGLSFGSIVEKDIKRRDVPDLIPLRVTDTLTGDDADKYYFKKDNGDGTYSWYLKEFSVDPIIKTCWKDSADDEEDGTEVTSEIYNSERTEGLQTFAEFILDFNTKDVREYYESIGSLDSARYNSIGLYVGEKVELEDGSFDYINVRLFSYLNIDNKSVKIKTASQYVYRILSLV